MFDYLFQLMEEKKKLINHDVQEKEINALKAMYEISIKARDFEIGQLINRNNFFMLFQGVLLASIMQGQVRRSIVAFIISFSGVWISFYQLQMASRAKFWQEWWESRVDYFEKLLCEKLKQSGRVELYELFAIHSDKVQEVVQMRLSSSNKNRVTNFLILHKFSVGRPPIRVAIVLMITWACLTCYFGCIMILHDNFAKFLCF